MRQIGTVKFFNGRRGFGFIKPDEGEEDVFVHITVVESSGMNALNEGMRISFELESGRGDKGPKATHLQPV